MHERPYAFFLAPAHRTMAIALSIVCTNRVSVSSYILKKLINYEIAANVAMETMPYASAPDVPVAVAAYIF